jgi:hypothetical protein
MAAWSTPAARVWDRLSCGAAGHDILQRSCKSMTHVQFAGNVRRRHDYRKGLLFGIDNRFEVSFSIRTYTIFLLLTGLISPGHLEL